MTDELEKALDTFQTIIDGYKSLDVQLIEMSRRAANSKSTILQLVNFVCNNVGIRTDEEAAENLLLFLTSAISENVNPFEKDGKYIVSMKKQEANDEVVYLFEVKFQYFYE